MERESLKKSNSSKQKYKDDKMVSGNNNSLLVGLSALGIVAGGVGAYKAGMLKGLSKKVLEGADLYRMNSLNIAPTVKSFNSWANMNKIETKNINSAFRNSIGSNVKMILNKDSAKSLYTDTTKDLADLKFRVKESRQVAEKVKNFNNMDHFNAELLSEIRKINRISSQVSKKRNGKANAKRTKNVMSEFLHDDIRVTKEQAKNQLKTHGYRTMTLNDIVDVVDDGKGYKTLISKREDFKLDKDSIELLQDFMKETRMSSVNNEGRKVKGKVIDNDTWRDFAFDSGIMIDKKGKIIDVRYASETPKEFIRSISNDLQIPGLGFNPLRFFGGDKVGTKKSRFGVIHQGTVQNALIGDKGRTTVKDSNKFGDMPLIFINGNVFQFNDNKSATLNKIDLPKMQIERISTNTSSYGIRSDLNSYRKMMGIRTKEYELYNREEDGTIKALYSSVMKKFDLGFQDRDTNKVKKVVKNADGVEKSIVVNQDEGYFSVNRLNENIREAIFSKIPKPYKSEREVSQISGVFGSVNKDEDLYLLRHKDTSIKDVLTKDDEYALSDYIDEIFASSEDPTKVGDKSVMFYALADRLNQTLSQAGVGLSMDSMGSSASIIGNLALKRVLPIYGAYQTIQYVTHLSERDDENKGNIQKDIADAFKAVDLGIHKLKDKTGLTSVIKKLTDLTPGSDNITELPGIYSFGIDQTYEERSKYYESGMDAVRKGRYWTMGNTPYTGGKISYFKPNLYRRIQGDVTFSDSLYGSREEYFDNAWFSSPIKHFVTDRYHYDKKHYYDRPYMVTSTGLENIPIVGGTLSSTVGQIIKPQRQMHTEYWGQQEARKDEAFNTPNDKFSPSYPVVGDANIGSGSSSVVKTANAQSDADSGKKNVLYITSGGQFATYDIGDKDATSLKYDVKKESISKINGVNKVNITDREYELGSENIFGPSSIGVTLSSQYTNLTNLTGMAGYMTETFVTKTPFDGAEVYDTSAYSTSFNKSFWDQELGGFGGEISEIFRRFIPDKNKDFEYINTVKNNQASWMPGSDYMTDFTVGDPYSKVKWGEGRIAGEGYERLWNMKDPLTMGIGSSSIGKSEEDIRKHFLNQDTITDDYLQNIVDTGTRMHESIEKELIRDGIALDVEQDVYDKDNGIKGTYDVRLGDGNSLTGKSGIMDIKTINEKGYRTIEDTGEIKSENKSQVNFYLKHMNEDRGYVMYVNRNNPEERRVLSFDYDEDLYQSDMDKIERVRTGIKDDIDNGVIGRGELYNHMDRVRILADVAPYSDEYKQEKDLLRANMTDEEAEELKEIEERVAKQKEPFRVYDYKFKTANLVEESVEIDKVIDDGVFTIKGDDTKSYKLGGIETVPNMTDEERENYNSMLSKTIKEGNNITLKLDADELKQKPTGTNDSVKSIVFDNGKMLNRELIKEGFVTAKDSNDALSVNVKYSSFDKLVGSTWERLSHLNVFEPINTKYLQVKSPLERYERNVVYGEDFQEWDRPIENFLKPTVNRMIEHPIGLVLAPLIGASFGRKPSTSLIGAGIGLAAVLTGKVFAKGDEIITGESWVPKSRKEETDIDEYVDKLNYVKNMKLYNEYSEKSISEDGFDVKEYQEKQRVSAEKRKSKKRKLESVKKDVNYGKTTFKDYSKEHKEYKLSFREKTDLAKSEISERLNLIKSAAKSMYSIKDNPNNIKKVKDKLVNLSRLDEEYDSKEEKIIKSKITSDIKSIDNNRNVDVIPENALMALEYYEKAQQTVYGYDQGESVQNLMKAIPKIERDYFKYFIKAPEEERDRILEVIPGYLKGAMLNMWGKSSEKEPLTDYFREHQLPDSEWIGWDEDVSLDSVKVKLVDDAGKEMSSFNIWDDDIKEANSQEIPVPYVNRRSSANYVQSQLQSMLKDSGYENVRIRAKKSIDNKINFNVNNDARPYVESKIQSEEFNI